MADDVPTQLEAQVADDQLEGEAPQTNAEAAQALASNIKIPYIDFNDPNRQSLAPRGSRDGKVFTNGCPKCGGELSAEN